MGTACVGGANVDGFALLAGVARCNELFNEVTHLVEVDVARQVGECGEEPRVAGCGLAVCQLCEGQWDALVIMGNDESAGVMGFRLDEEETVLGVEAGAEGMVGNRKIGDDATASGVVGVALANIVQEGREVQIDLR